MFCIAHSVFEAVSWAGLAEERIARHNPVIVELSLPKPPVATGAFYRSRSQPKCNLLAGDLVERRDFQSKYLNWWK
jgi:hypothetical protein